MPGPMAATRSSGREPNSSLMRPTPDSTMRLTVPLQPAWKAATARRLRSATRTGMQSAVWMPSSRPGSSVIRPSPLHPSDEDLSLGTPPLHPSDEDLSLGTPPLHPSDEDLSLGTPPLHPSDEDLSLGTPALHG